MEKSSNLLLGVPVTSRLCRFGHPKTPIHCTPLLRKPLRLWIFCAEAVCPEFRLSVLRSCSQNNPVTSKNVAGQKKEPFILRTQGIETCPSINSFHSPTCEYLNLEFQSSSSTVLYPWVSVSQVK